MQLLRLLRMPLLHLLGLLLMLLFHLLLLLLVVVLLLRLLMFLFLLLLELLMFFVLPVDQLLLLIAVLFIQVGIAGSRWLYLVLLKVAGVRRSHCVRRRICTGVDVIAAQGSVGRSMIRRACFPCRHYTAAAELRGP